MSESYIFNGQYGAKLSELFSTYGEAAEAYVWTGSSSLQIIPPIDDIYGDVLSSWAGASAAFNYFGFANPHNGTYPTELGSEARLAGLDDVRVELSDTYATKLMGTFVSPIAACTDFLPNGIPDVDYTRWNIGKLVFKRYDKATLTPLDDYTYHLKYSTRGNFNSPGIELSGELSGLVDEDIRWDMPEVHLFDDNPILIAEVTHEVASLGTSPRWSNGSGGYQTTIPLVASEAGSAIRLLDDGADRIYFKLYQQAADGYSPPVDYLNSIGDLVVTVERVSEGLPEEALADLTYVIPEASSYDVQTSQGSNLSWDWTAGDPTKLGPGETITVRIYKYNY